MTVFVKLIPREREFIREVEQQSQVGDCCERRGPPQQLALQQSAYPEHPAVTVGYRSRSTAVQARRRWEGAHKQPGCRSRI
jgi:hypothetical protein